jgi:hypothetical protein
VFVAVLGASSFIYAEATASQALADWIGSHVNALTALGGVPRQIVSDNLKAGITKACFYEPTVECGVRNYVAFVLQVETIWWYRRLPGDKWNEQAKCIAVTLLRAAGEIAFNDNMIQQKASDPRSKQRGVTHGVILSHNAESICLLHAVIRESA